MANEGDIIYKKIRESGLVMSRVPRDIKELFVNLAGDQFCDDFGLCFKWVFDQAMEYQKMKSILFTDMIDKINYIADNVQEKDTDEEEELPQDSGHEKIVRLINGKQLKYLGGKDE